MELLIQFIHDWLADRGFEAGIASWVATACGVVFLIVLAWLANLVAKGVILRVVSAAIRRSSFKWDDAMMRAGVFTRLSHLAPALVINALGDDVFGDSPEVMAGIGAAVGVYLTLIWLGVFFALLNTLQTLADKSGHTSRMPVKGFIQAVKLVATLLGLVLVLSTLLDKSPIYLLSGLGALTAVLLLVFRDAILGFVAGIMISVNQLARIGDWIEMPKAGADGDVIDISLTTVKVQNWDKTITTIPAYDLISSSFKNWRGMSESGGRRIKRALPNDMRSVRFADEEMVERWSRMDLLRDYLDGKQREIEEENTARGTDLSVLGNGRRMTNLGTFRAYCIAYLRNHPRIHQKMTFLVRQLAPTDRGMPLEIYVFTNDIRWAAYEAIQSDVFDHLLAVIEEFDLRVFQAPSGGDVQSALTAGARIEASD
jgi:miniconductance mechanosensitive channel